MRLAKRVVPRLLKNKPIVPQTQLAVDEDHLNFIHKAMWGVVDHGTAAAAKLPLDGIQMAGKTGTAQTHNLSRPANAATIPPRDWKLRDHSLFMAFVPFDNPRYAAATIVEHGGFGAAVAAPLIRDTLTFFTTSRKRSRRCRLFEQSIGGTPTERDGSQDRRAGDSANGLPPLPAKQA